MQISGAQWSKVYISDSSDLDDCHKCHARIRKGDAYQFIGGWNVCKVWCARCSPIIKRDPASVEAAYQRMTLTVCNAGHETRLNGRKATFCMICLTYIEDEPTFTPAPWAN